MSNPISVKKVFEENNVLLMKTRWPVETFVSENDELDALRQSVSGRGFDIEGKRDTTSVGNRDTTSVGNRFVTDEVGSSRQVCSRFWEFRTKLQPKAP
jgi:hypothetical protein